ncbi:MAG: hypothetical protein AAFY56_24050, partial [Pseudomonadota bacterium]
MKSVYSRARHYSAFQLAVIDVRWHGASIPIFSRQQACMHDQAILEVLPWLIAVLLITGGAAGTLAGLLGVGGGIIIVPVLFWGL